MKDKHEKERNIMSINYYNNNAENFINDTFYLSMSELMNEFLTYVGNTGTILDLGCGSGRDALEFQKRGYKVFAVDGSKEMIAHTSKFLSDKAICSTFSDYETNIKFHGIWALASLLHVPEADMITILRKYRDLLAEDGVFFMSFKNRKNNYEKDGRCFTCYTKEKLLSVLSEVGSLDVIKFIDTVDIREGREDEKWISAIVKASDR
ncbi:MAG: SAM-dependent methyltransferase [Firmicutes bacterium HGW-Firmicutes-3]|jgi:2-polyprenyl-3-methyl-5-hydroxy-6-metoxy-1,4-benzoquinol methylase|nr:MAG: SAM-dependent methyltransferase [Firmicutes bacterium HGW-Firmicutes-3]